jgi:multimeric flavodoxin WrbA
MKASEYIQIKSKEWFELVSIEEAAKYHKRNVERCLAAIEYHKKQDRPINILAVYGSGRSNYNSCAQELSNSQLLLRGALEQFRNNPKYDVTEIPLRSYEIEPCNSCYSSSSALCGFPCLPGSERVTTMAGVHAISEIRAGDILPSGQVEQQWQSSPSSQIFKLTLSDGRSLKLTANHPVKVRRFGNRTNIGKKDGKYLYGRKYQDIWIEAQALSSGDCVPFPLGGGFATPAEERVDLARMAGLVWGDGTTRGKLTSPSYIWYVPESDKEHISAVDGKVPAWISVRSHSTLGMLKVAWSAEQKRQLDAWGFDKTGPAKERRVPIKIMRDASENEVCGFLKEWFTTDGSTDIKKGRVSLCCASFDALRDAQLLLQKLGIASAVYQVKGTTVLGGREPVSRAHNLEIHLRSSVKKFADKIGFSLLRKQKVLEQITKNTPENINWREPVGKVISVVPAGTEPVYDISVAGSHEFVAEGIPVHNCNCFPLSPLHDIYPLVLKCDVMFCATGVNQSDMSSRLKIFLDRLISLDGGFYVSPEQFGPKDYDWRDKCIALATELSKRKEINYDARMWGRTAAYFISSKDEKNDIDTVARDYKELDDLSYIERVAAVLREGNADYGFFHDKEDWYAGCYADPNVEMAYDKKTTFSNPAFAERAALVARKAVELAEKIRKDPVPFDGGGRGKTRT